MGRGMRNDTFHLKCLGEIKKMSHEMSLEG